MRTISNLLATLCFALISLHALGQTPLPTEARRAELSKKADELRARNAKERDEIQRGFAPNRPQVTRAVPALTHAQICKATIAALMGRPPAIVSIAAEEAGVIFLAYQRPSDSTIWRNRCKVSGTGVMWASEPGRWRDNPLDEKVTYRVQGTSDLVIRQQFSDGSASEKIFAIAAL